MLSEVNFLFFEFSTLRASIKSDIFGHSQLTYFLIILNFRGIQMKKITKRILFIILAILVILTVLYIFYAFPMLSMKPPETGQIPGTNIFTIKNEINAVYFIKTESGYIMIDGGINSKKIEASLEEAGIKSNDIKWIFLTHSDYDHVAALALFHNSAIYMSQDELPLVNGTAKRTLFGRNTMPAGIDISKITLLSDQQEISCGSFNVKCIKAPGHTIGSMVYLIENRYLFTGDAIRLHKGTISIHPYTMNKAQAKKTIEHLKGIIENSELVLTAHYGKL